MDETLLQDLLELVKHRYFGKYRGQVVNTEDDTKRGRLLVRVPAVLGELEVWAMPCVPYAGAGVGFYALPPADSGVWIEFEAGDPSYPIWVGCFWADNQLPDDANADIKVLKTDKLILRLDDGNDQLSVKTSSKTEFSMDDKILHKAGDVSLNIDSSSITSDSKGTGKIVVDGAGVNINNQALEVN